MKRIIRKLTKRQKLYVAIVFLLLALNFGKFLSFNSLKIPTKGKIQDEKQKIIRLQAQLSNLKKAGNKRDEELERLASLTKDFWPSSGKAVTNKIQQKIERLGRKSGVTLKKVGAPKIAEITDNIEAIDITVSSTTKMKDLAKFLKEIENHHPKLIWNNCVIRPNRTKSPTAVNISGKVRAYILSKTASEFMNSEAQK